jgi:hypothetical protein
MTITTVQPEADVQGILALQRSVWIIDFISYF